LGLERGAHAYVAVVLLALLPAFLEPRPRRVDGHTEMLRAGVVAEVLYREFVDAQENAWAGRLCPVDAVQQVLHVLLHVRSGIVAIDAPNTGLDDTDRDIGLAQGNDGIAAILADHRLNADIFSGHSQTPQNH